MPKIGKSTFGSKMPSPLFLAFEKGYNALPGVFAQDINSWSELKSVARELKKPEVRERYKSLIIDTSDVAADKCQKYICNKLGIENIGDGGWTNNGWSLYKKEFEDTFRELAMLGYAILFISHDKEKTIKPKEGDEYQQICSSMQTSALNIIESMSDIIGYAHPKLMPDGNSRPMLTLRSFDNSVRCGCRFKYIKPEIEFSYPSLVDALNEAIDKEAGESNGQFVTDERQKINEAPVYDYDALMNEFNQIVSKLMAENQDNANKITFVTNKYLGKGKKVSNTTPEQAEFINLIVEELKDEFNMQ